MLTAAGWASWTPADDHGLWDDLVKAFDDVGGAFGGVPKIDRILFFQTAYKYDTAKRGRPGLVPHKKEGAYVSGTTMGVNEHGSKDQLNLPTATTRSKEGKKGINVGVASRVQVMTHEVGHGLVQAFLSEDPIGESAALRQGRRLAPAHRALRRARARGARGARPRRRARCRAADRRAGLVPAEVEGAAAVARTR